MVVEAGAAGGAGEEAQWIVSPLTDPLILERGIRGVGIRRLSRPVLCEARFGATWTAAPPGVPRVLGDHSSLVAKPISLDKAKDR